MSSEAELALKLTAKNLASREVDKLNGSLGDTPKRAKGASGALGGLGKVAGVVALTGIGALVGGLFMATKAAAEEQVGIVRLNAALKASDKSFTGNTDAIEAAIAKRQALAFSDDELRASLTFLVTKTKDSTKALALQTTAMDLARLRGISLEEASAMLTKGLDGNAKVLKQLGIDLPKTATEQERLTAIQKAAAGQAEAYGKSATGAQESFQIALGDLVEDVGSAFLPVMTEMFTALREHVIPAIRSVGAAVGKWLADNKPLIEQIKKIVGTYLKNLWTVISKVVDWVGKMVSTIANNRDAMNVLRTVAEGIATAIGLMWKAIETVVGWIASLVGAITRNKAIMRGFGQVFDIIAGAVRGVVDAIKSIIKFGQDAIGIIGHLADLLPDIKVSAPAPDAGGFMTQAASSQGFQMAAAPASAGMAGFVPVELPVVVDGREIARIVDRRLYLDLRRAAPTASGA